VYPVGRGVYPVGRGVYPVGLGVYAGVWVQGTSCTPLYTSDRPYGELGITRLPLLGSHWPCAGGGIGSKGVRSIGGSGGVTMSCGGMSAGGVTGTGGTIGGGRRTLSTGAVFPVATPET